MTDLRIYDFEFHLLAIAKDVISSRWVLRYNGVGTYEGHFRIDSSTAELILKHRYLVLTEGDKQAVCTGKIAGDELILCGRTVNWLLGKRVLPPFKTSEIFGEYMSPEEILHYVLEMGFLNPPQIDPQTGQMLAGTQDAAKRVENFYLCEKIGTPKLSRHFWRLSANTVLELVVDLAELMGVGHQLIFDPIRKCWQFSYIQGTERTLVLAEDYRTACHTEYTEDFLEYATGGWYEKPGDAESEGTWNYVETDSDLQGIYRWDAVLSGVSENEALTSLQKRQQVSTATLDTIGLRFGTDYQLGDVFLVGIQKGGFEKKLRAKVTGVNLWSTGRDAGEEPVLSILKEETNGI